ERVEGAHALDEVVLPEPVEGAHGEAARVDRGAFLDERLQLVVDGQVPGEGLLPDGGVPAGARGEQHAGAVQDDGYVEALADQPGGGEQVHQSHGPLVRNGVDE